MRHKFRKEKKKIAMPNFSFQNNNVTKDPEMPTMNIFWGTFLDIYRVLQREYFEEKINMKKREKTGYWHRSVIFRWFSACLKAMPNSKNSGIRSQTLETFFKNCLITKTQRAIFLFTFTLI